MVARERLAVYANAAPAVARIRLSATITLERYRDARKKAFRKKAFRKKAFRKKASRRARRASVCTRRNRY